MNAGTRQKVRELVKFLAPADYSRLVETGIRESCFGYDPFGLERETVMLAFVVFKALHNHWFRVQSSGVENIPLNGPVLLTPNHSGVFPIDGAMLAVDLCTKLKKPRIMRAVVDNFACCLPFISTFFARCGQVHGARGNVRRLLKQGELVTLFPEGHKGTGKRYRERYKLRPFNVGFMEMSLTYKAPIVPTAVIGAEEQYPYMFNVKPLAKALHFPYMPATPLLMLLGPLGLLPLPTKYVIRYGEPLHFYKQYPPETVEDVDTIRHLVGRVRSRVQEMVEEGLRERKSIFGFSLPSLRKPLPLIHEALDLRRKRAEQRKRRTESNELAERRPESPGRFAVPIRGVAEPDGPAPWPVERAWERTAAGAVVDDGRQRMRRRGSPGRLRSVGGKGMTVRAGSGRRLEIAPSAP